MIAFMFTPQVTSPQVKVVPLTLEEEARAAGLQVIDLERVAHYQEQIRLEWQSLSPHYLGWWETVEESDIASLNPPASVLTNIQRAKTIPSAVVFAERFEADPFYFLARVETNEIVCFDFHDAPGFDPNSWVQ